jgi:hypothetical protein
LQCVSGVEPSRRSSGRVLAHAPAALDLDPVDVARPLGEIAVRLSHLRHRPREIDRRGPRGDQHLRGFVEVLPVRGGERVAVRRGDADRRRAADDHRADRVRDLLRRAALDLDLLVGESPLVEEDDAVASSRTISSGRRSTAPPANRGLTSRKLSALVPRSQVLRLLLGERVDLDPFDSSLRRAISRSMSSGTT